MFTIFSPLLRSMDQLSDSSGDLLSHSSDQDEGTDEEGSAYYPYTSAEITRIAFPRKSDKKKGSKRRDRTERDLVLGRVRDSFNSISSYG